LKVLIKLGGTLLDDAASRRRLASEIIAASREHQITVVHGGGKQMTRFLAERGIESKFVNGLRVSSPEVIDAVVKVFAGSVNKELVSAFVREGASAVGLCGLDGGLVECEVWNEELGAVGRPVRSNAKLLDLLCANGFLPVVACVGGDAAGHIYNVNADQMAAAIAVAFQADRLLFLTDVEGVRGADSATLPRLTVEGARCLIADGVAAGGMQAKLEAAIGALHGSSSVHIAAGAQPGIVDSLLKGERLGTLLVP